MNLKLVITENGSPVIENNKLVVWDVDGNCPVHLDVTPENLASFNLRVKINSSGETPVSETELLSDEQPAVNSETKNLQSQLLNISGKKSTASWKDNYAVKTLIEEWRGHESYFKSTTITNKKVWDMIANKLKKENPLWDYTGQQCEDKFKDLRKHYVKARDHNEKSSGLPVVTCKFYKEMDDALGDKPSMKPVAIASTLKKRNQSSSLDSSSTASVLVGSNSEDNDSEHGCDSTPKSKKKKKSVTERNIERLITIRTEESKKKEEARHKRHTERLERQDRAIEVYQQCKCPFNDLSNFRQYIVESLLSLQRKNTLIIV